MLVREIFSGTFGSLSSFVSYAHGYLLLRHELLDEKELEAMFNGAHAELELKALAKTVKSEISEPTTHGIQQLVHERVTSAVDSITGASETCKKKLLQAASDWARLVAPAIGKWVKSNADA